TTWRCWTTERSSRPDRQRRSGMTRGCSTPTSARRRTTMPKRGSAASKPGSAALVIDSVTAGYGGGRVLHHISIPVAQGGITCVVGRNGCGKSTLLATISGLLRPRRGTITFRGEPLVGRSPSQVLRAGIVHVPQVHSLFREMTVAENIELGGYLLADRRQVTRRRGAGGGEVPARAEGAGQKGRRLSGGPQRL